VRGGQQHGYRKEQFLERKRKKRRRQMPNALGIVQKFFPGVTTVQDASKDVVIEVTKKDEASAHRRSHKTCAMAVACKRKFESDGVIVSLKTAYVIDGSTATRYHLPENVSREVVSFDREAGFAPGEYQMKKPRGSKRLGKHYGGANGKHKHTGVKRFHPHITTGIRSVLGSKQAFE
jgi:hypothetical protein